MVTMILNIYKLLDRKEHKTFRLYAVLSFIAPIIELASISAILPILQKMTKGAVSRGTLLTVIGLGILVLCKGVFDLMKNLVSTKFVYLVSKRLSLMVFEKHSKESLLEHNDKTAASMLTAIRTDSSAVVGVLRNAVSLLVTGVMWVGYVCILIYTVRWLGVITAVLLSLSMIVTYLLNRKRIRKYGDRIRTQEIRINAIITAAYGAYKELKINTKSSNMLKRYDAAAQENAVLQREYSFLTTMINVVLSNTMQAAIYFIVAVLIILEINIAEYVVPVMAFMTILMKLIPETNAIIRELNAIRYAEKSYVSFMDNMKAYHAIVEHEKETAGLRQRKITIEKELRVENLTFSYPNGRVIFENANVTLPANHTIAIVGNSGIGKTSFLDLILGLLKPSEGHIYYDDYDIVTGSDAEGRCNGNLGEIVSYIPQVVYMNGDSVKNNVLFMTPPEEADEDRVRQCLECAHVWEDVKNMPQGMDTIIGANGTNISGGQRQRIAMARALYRDFDLLVMDEATAALDTDTEKAVIDSIREMQNGKSLIMVTHHMSLAEECEYIYKIENRQIVRVR